MLIWVRLIGIIILGFGIVFLISPRQYKAYISFWTKKGRIRTGAGLSILVSIIMLLAASQCRVSWFVALMGILALIKGIIILTIEPKKLISKMEWWMTKPPATLRLLSVVALAMGILLIYAAV